MKHGMTKEGANEPEGVYKDSRERWGIRMAWIPVTNDYKGELLEPFNVRWRHTDGTLSPVGNGEMRDGDIIVYWAEEIKKGGE